MAGNPTPGQQPQETFKQQLDRAAEQSRQGSGNQQGNPVLDKVTEYVPGASKFLGGPKQEEAEADNEKSGEIPGPPDRPDHDHKIEDFVRDQHRSNNQDGSLNSGS